MEFEPCMQSIHAKNNVHKLRYSDDAPMHIIRKQTK